MAQAAHPFFVKFHILTFLALCPQISTYKLILQWTTYYGHDVDIQDFNFLTMNCKHPCSLTRNHHALDYADAVVFYGADVRNFYPPYKPYGQKWVYIHLEPPHYSSISSMDSLGTRFDYFLSYIKEADVYAPYGQFLPKPEPDAYEYVPKVLFHGKSRDVAWFVSNCYTVGKREDMVHQMKKYIHIDVYGSCGTFHCSRKDELSCYQMLEKSYKFYLSFENSVCKEYVTEKLFKVMQYDVIPIVYGGADYKSFMPPNSYIDVMNFTTAYELAQHIRSVGRDEKVYNSYFQWKKYQKVDITRMGCQLCKALHKNVNGVTHQKLGSFFANISQCKGYGESYKLIN